MTVKYMSAITLLAALTVSLPSVASAGCSSYRSSCSTYSYPVVSRHYSGPTTRSYYSSSWSTSRPIHHSYQTANCPSNTSRQPDGTCLLRHYSSGIYGTHGIYGSSYSYGSSIYSGRSYSTGLYGHTEYLPCPHGTVQQPDRSCLVSGGVLRTPGYSSSYISPYTGTYSWSSYGQAVPVAPYAAPAAQSGPEVVIYTGGAQAPTTYQPVATHYPVYR